MDAYIDGFGIFAANTGELAGCDRLDFGNRALLAAEIFLTRASRDGNQPHEEQRQAQHADMGGIFQVSHF